MALALDEIEISTSISNEINVKAAWHGNKLKGLLKTIIIAVKFKKGKHNLTFTPNQKPYLKNITISQVEEKDKIIYIPTDNNPTEKGDRRPWLSFVLINLSIKDIAISAKVNKQGRDDDDIKLIIDGKIEKNENKNSHQDWYWCGKILKGKEKIFTKVVNWQGGLHYFDLWADESPFLYKVELVLADNNKLRIPTVDDPEWTGNYFDDSEQMILARTIFGEARSLPEQGKIAVGWSIKNRVIDTRWCNNFHDVILERKQYSAFNLNDKNLPYVRNPLLDKTQIIDWHECYKIAGQIITGEVSDPTGGANHYYSEFIKPPYWTKSKNAYFKLKIGNTLFYEIKQNQRGFIKIKTIILVLVSLIILIFCGLYLVIINNSGYLSKREKTVDVSKAPLDKLVNGEYGEMFFVINGKRQRVVYKNRGIDHLAISPNKKRAGFFYESGDYYKSCHKVALVIINIQEKKAKKIYESDCKISRWEWISDNHVAIYKNCGTECQSLHLIDVNSEKENILQYGVDYNWSPDKELVLAYHFSSQYGILVGDKIGNELLAISREQFVSDDKNLALMTKAVWSPDSSKLAVIIKKEKENKMELLIFKIKDNFKKIYQEKIYQADVSYSDGLKIYWSDDNKKVVYGDLIINLN